LADLPKVQVTYSESEVEIKDNCGGIELDHAKDEAFNFGHSPDWKTGYLGVYGVGLKRALFKFGDEFLIESQTIKDGFKCHLDVPEWLKKDESIDDWRIPIQPTHAARSPKSAGTTIKIHRLHDEVKMRLKSGSIDALLYKAVSRTYSFFIGKYVRIFLNEKEVERFSIPVAKPTGGTVSYDEFSENHCCPR
jgi:hypothetical protein